MPSRDLATDLGVNELHSDLAQALAAFQRGDLDRSLVLARKAAAHEASHQADHLLGLIHCRRGELEAGVDHLRRAASADPDNPAYRLILSRALVDSGRAMEALALPRPKGTAAPADLALWHARAEAADANGDLSAASEAWRIVAEARPSDWRAWHNLGNALAGMDQWAEAARVLGQAVALNPSEAAGRRNLAAALANSEQAEAAVAEFEAAVGLDPNHAGSRLALAQQLARLGRHEDALAQLDAAAALGPEGYDAALARGRSLAVTGDYVRAEQALRAALTPADPAAIKELGLLLERTSQMEAMGVLLGEAETQGVDARELGYLHAALALREGRAGDARDLLQAAPADDPVLWHRLMAKIADALGDSATAFAEAEAMNRATPGYDDWRAQGRDYRQRVRGLAPLITGEWIGRLTPLAPPARRAPAFLVGFPRSGTTLLDTFLMGHPDIAVIEEGHMIGAAELVAGHFPDLPDCPPETLSQARDAYFAELDRLVDRDFGGLVIDKQPFNMIGLPLVRTLFPDAPVMFAQRHPCDAVLSAFMQGFILNQPMASFLDIADAADLYDAAMDVWTRSRELLPTDVQTLIYEELIADPEAALKPLVAFLGLEWSDQVLDHRTTAKARGAIVTASYDQVTEPLNMRSSGRWRRYREQLEPVLPVLLPWAERLGYE